MDSNLPETEANAQQEEMPQVEQTVSAPPMEGFLKSKTSFRDKTSLKTIGLAVGGTFLLGVLGFGAWFAFTKLTGRDMKMPSFTVSSGGGMSGSDIPSITHPINGIQYTSSDAKRWQARRPMAVMVNNHADSRPQKGLSLADLIYEAVAEGGISRFLAIYHSKLPEIVGPMRSARVYYIDWAKEYDAWYAHWGHAQSNNEANAFARMQSIFVSSIESANACEYDKSLNRDLEHTLYCDFDTLYQAGYDLYPDQPLEFSTLESWKFKDECMEPAELGDDKAISISFNFWELPEYAVEWRYNSESNKYDRFQGGEQQIDALNNEPLTASNIIVSFMQERSLNDEKQHIIYEDIGTGDALVFLDGRVIEAEWQRLAYSDRTVFTDKLTGKEIEFNRGQVWIEVLPDRNEELVVYK